MDYAAATGIHLIVINMFLYIHKLNFAKNVKFYVPHWTYGDLELLTFFVQNRSLPKPLQQTYVDIRLI